MKIANTMDVRMQNARAIIRDLELRGTATNAEIAQKHGLSVATVSNIVNILKKGQLIRDAGTAVSTGGRKPVIVELNPEYRYFAGINVTKHLLQSVLLRFDGSVVAMRFIYREFEESNSYWTFLRQQYDELTQGIGFSCGVGIAFPGQVDTARRCVTGTRTLGRDWICYDGLLPLFEQPVAIHDSARLAGLAQLYNRDLASNAVYLLLSRRVCGTLLRNKEIFMLGPMDCNFGEMILSHQGVGSSGQDCRTFCDVCSAGHIIDILRSQGYDYTYPGFFREIEEGNQAFADLWQEYLENLAVAIHNLRAIFGIDIIVGGEMAEFLRPCFTRLCGLIHGLADWETPERYLHFSEYGQYDDAIGAALYARDQDLVAQLPAVLKDEDRGADSPYLPTVPDRSEEHLWKL